MDLKRILVFRTGHLGDTLVAVPAFWALRHAYPDSTISYLSSADAANPQYVSARDVLPEKGMFDDWISYPNLSSGFADIFLLLGLALKIRRKRFDAVFYMMTRYRTARQIQRDKLFFKLAGIRNIVGAEFVRKHNLPLEIPKPVPTIEKEGTFLLRLLREKGIVDRTREFHPDLALTQEERSAVTQWMDSAGITKYAGPRIAVGPGSKWDSKIWDEARYADVVARLIASHDVVPVIFGGPEDREKGERLIAVWGRGANAAGSLSVRKAAAALSECTFYLGNDTGTMHLAASVGTTCVAMFSAVDWAGRFEPVGTQHTLFRRSVECEGCHSPTCLNKEFRNKCLKLIAADDVFEACVSVLESQPNPV
ncbi:MAG TPA: glycosyltransferase family 9 protein [Pyrinomonadaceae bacterium]|nr:glycosyltransferase family 9 protein [Pyrinomonadaceae bacterium]